VAEPGPGPRPWEGLKEEGWSAQDLGRQLTVSVPGFRSQASGKQITNAEMEQYLMSQFRSAMSAVEEQVYQELHTNEEEVRAATEFYKDDEDFKRTLNKLKTLFKAVTGQQQTELVEVPEHLTMKKTLDIMSEIMVGINEQVERIHEELTGKGLSPESDDFKKELQERYMEGVGVLRTSVHEKHEVNEDLLHAAVIKYQQDEEFQRTLLEISNKHRARLEKVGFQQ